MASAKDDITYSYLAGPDGTEGCAACGAGAGEGQRDAHRTVLWLSYGASHPATCPHPAGATRRCTWLSTMMTPLATPTTSASALASGSASASASASPSAAEYPHQ